MRYTECSLTWVNGSSGLTAYEEMEICKNKKAYSNLLYDSEAYNHAVSLLVYFMNGPLQVRFTDIALRID